MLDAATSCLSTDSAQDEFAVTCNNVSLARGKDICIDRLDLRVRRGAITGLIGADGAGKTSLLHMISGVIEPAAGDIRVFGLSPRDARLDIAYVTQNNSLFPELTVDENLAYSGGVRNVSKEQLAERKTKYLKAFGLHKFSDRLAKDLSGGMKQKVALLCALISMPKLLLLDEPTSGLDPIARREFWQMLSGVCEDGITALVATPRMEEGELCSEIAWMHNGRVYCSGSPRKLRQDSQACRLVLKTQDPALITLLSDPQVQATTSIFAITLQEREIVLLVGDAKKSPELLAELLEKNSIQAEMSRAQPSLDDVFVIYQYSKGSEHACDSASFSGLLSQLGSPKAEGFEIKNLVSHPAIQAQKLSKNFGSFTAVDGVSIDVRYGEIYGLLGANGAGKTSTIKMICGLLKPSEGVVRFADKPLKSDEHEWRSQLGYMSQKMALYRDLSGMENLQFYASTYCIPSKKFKERIEWACDVFQLKDTLHIPVASLPGGLQQRLAFASAVLHEPKILILDEPTSGIDPSGRRQMWSIIKELSSTGVAVLVTTHFIEEAEYCDRIGVMTQGRLVGENAPNTIRVEAGNVLEIFTPRVRDSFECLSKHVAPWRISILPDCLHIQSDSGQISSALVERELRIAGLPFTKPRLIAPSLEEAVIALVHDSGGLKQ
jgi:ABC-2 type transport system ATP-binding protein